MCNRGGFPADSFYEVRHECGDVSRPRFKIKVGKTLSPRRWHSMLTPEGYLDFAKALSRIQRGGVHPSIRGEVWEFLLGCYDPQSTFDERDQLRKKRRLEYARQKEECREMDPLVGRGRIITAPIITENGEPIDDPIVLLEANLDEVLNSRERDDVVVEVSSSSVPQENGTEDTNSNAIVEEEKVKKPVCLDKKVIQWKRILHQIGLDVVRTDRALVFYEQQENLSKLWDILAVYAWIDKDVGYCQGMSDLCSPMIVLLENEADAFWCFERLMRRLRGNFRCTETSVGVERLLSSLASVTQILDPKLHQHLETIGGGGYLFAFRMLMVLFRREFSFGDSLYLWEMMWALEYDPYLFSICEHQESVADIKDGSRGKAKSLRQFGKFERQNVKNGRSQVGSQEGNLPISVFIVANVLKLRSSKLMREARGVDDVVKILNDTNGRLDAKKACTGAMKLHKKYLKKVKKH